MSGSAKRASITTPESVAALIAGTVPPDWLVKAVERGAKMIRRAFRDEAARPKRVDVRARFKALAAAAELIDRGLFSDIWILSVVPEASRDDIENWMVLRQQASESITWIKGQCDIGLAALRGGPGAGKAWESVSAKQFAGVLVAGCWAALNDEVVPVTNARAIAALRGLLTLAGQRGGSDSSATRFLRFGATELEWNGEAERAPGPWQPVLQTMWGKDGLAAIRATLRAIQQENDARWRAELEAKY